MRAAASTRLPWVRSSDGEVDQGEARQDPRQPLVVHGLGGGEGLLQEGGGAVAVALYGGERAEKDQRVGRVEGIAHVSAGGQPLGQSGLPVSIGPQVGLDDSEQDERPRPIGRRAAAVLQGAFQPAAALLVVALGCTRSGRARPRAAGTARVSPASSSQARAARRLASSASSRATARSPSGSSSASSYRAAKARKCAAWARWAGVASSLSASRSAANSRTVSSIW